MPTYWRSTAGRRSACAVSPPPLPLPSSPTAQWPHPLRPAAACPRRPPRALPSDAGAPPVCCGVLQCVVVCCNHVWNRPPQAQARCCVLRRIAVCCSVLRYVAECCEVLLCVAVCCGVLHCVAIMYGIDLLRGRRAACVLQCVAVCCSVLQCVAGCCSVWPCGAASGNQSP